MILLSHSPSLSIRLPRRIAPSLTPLVSSTRIFKAPSPPLQLDLAPPTIVDGEATSTQTYNTVRPDQAFSVIWVMTLAFSAVSEKMKMMRRRKGSQALVCSCDINRNQN